MTYEQIVKSVKKALAKADVSKAGNAAIQVDIVGEGEGAFYVKVNDGTLAIEPYEYYDHDAKLIVSGKDCVDLFNGKLDAVKAYESGKITVEGNLDSVLKLKDMIPEKKTAAKKTTAKKTAAKKTTAKKSAAKTAAPKADVKAAAKPAEKKTAAKPAAKKTTAKKATAKTAVPKADVKAAAKPAEKQTAAKPAAKKTTAKKAAETTAKKPAAKKTVAKKTTAAKKTSTSKNAK